MKSSQNSVSPKGKRTGPPVPSQYSASPLQAWVAGFLLNFRYGLLGKILLSDLSRMCMLHAEQLDVIPGGTSSKKYRDGHVRYLSMTQRDGKRKNLYPKIWVSVPKVFLLVNQPSLIFAIGNFKILFQVLTNVQ